MLLYNQFFFVLLQLYGSLDTQRYVVLPYERNSGNMTLIKENDLSEKYPMTYSYSLIPQHYSLILFISA